MCRVIIMGGLSQGYSDSPVMRTLNSTLLEIVKIMRKEDHDSTITFRF